MLIGNILLLVYRNVVAAIDKIFLIWQVAFPVVYIFVAGYAYSALIGHQGVKIGVLSVTYSPYLTAWRIEFNVMNGSRVAGNMIGKDNSNGSLQQLLVTTFTKLQYIISKLVTLFL